MSATSTTRSATRARGGPPGASSGAVALISNALDFPPDEGIKRCAQSLAEVFSGLGHPVVPISGSDPLLARELLASPSAVRRLREAGTDALIYLPTQSGTTLTFVRVALLRMLLRLKVVLLTLQPTSLTGVRGFLARHFGPQLLLTPSPSMLDEAVRCGLKADFVALASDPLTFRPVREDRKAELRREHGLPPDARIVLHVGHARKLRGLEWVAPLEGDMLPLVVVGKSLGAEPSVLAWLRDSGVRVVEDYVPDIQELYQLADVYAFPVTDDGSAVAVPLSVLEAMACNLPVVTTRFGGLPRMFEEGRGLFFADEPADFRAALERALDLSSGQVGTRRLAEGYSWGAIAETVISQARDV